MEAGGRFIGDDDRETLVGFVQEFHEVLTVLIERNPTLFANRTVALLAAALIEVERESRFPELEEGIRNRDFDRQLAAHGLYDRQLVLKIAIFEASVERVESLERRPFVTHKKRRRVWQVLLKAADVVLDSIADSIPGSGAIKELKESAEVALDEPVSLPNRVSAWVRRRRELRPAVLDETAETR